MEEKREEGDGNTFKYGVRRGSTYIIHCVGYLYVFIYNVYCTYKTC